MLELGRCRPCDVCARKLDVIDKLTVHDSFQEQLLVLIDANNVGLQVSDDLRDDPSTATATFLEAEEAGFVGRDQHSPCPVRHLGDWI